MKIVIEKELTKQEVEDILTTAFEGGIGYWSVINNDTDSWDAAIERLKKRGEECYYCTIAVEMWKAGDKVELLDAESEDLDNPDNTWHLGEEEFIKGCKLYEENRGSIRKTLDDGNFDAVEADCLIQYALFGEVIYG